MALSRHQLPTMLIVRAAPGLSQRTARDPTGILRAALAVRRKNLRPPQQPGKGGFYSKPRIRAEPAQQPGKHSGGSDAIGRPMMLCSQSVRHATRRRSAQCGYEYSPSLRPCLSDRHYRLRSMSTVIRTL
eukprot:COSAG01_NODE_1447_length_10278_cov_47.625209_5_plen_130_part_00